MEFNKDTINKLANLLMFDLNEEESSLILSEFNIIDKNINKINDIKNIDKIEAMTHALDNFEVELRNDIDNPSASKEEILKNSKDNDQEYVVIPKVV